MQPGDLIEWAYIASGKVVDANEMVWSSPMQRWVPIGGFNLLVSITDTQVVWLCDNRLFHARVDDPPAKRQGVWRSMVVPCIDDGLR